MDVYKYGLSNTIKEIVNALADASMATNKREKARYIGEAYGMAKALSFIIEDGHYEEMAKSVTKTTKKTNNT